MEETSVCRTGWLKTLSALLPSGSRYVHYSSFPSFFSFLFFFTFFHISIYLCVPRIRKLWVKVKSHLWSPGSFFIFNYPLSSSSGVFSFFLLPRARIWINPNAWLIITWHSPPYGEYFKSYLLYFLGINLHLFSLPLSTPGALSLIFSLWWASPSQPHPWFTHPDSLFFLSVMSVFLYGQILGAVYLNCSCALVQGNLILVSAWPYLHTLHGPIYILRRLHASSTYLLISYVSNWISFRVHFFTLFVCLFILSCLHSFIHPLASLDQVTEPSKMISQPEQ